MNHDQVEDAEQRLVDLAAVGPLLDPLPAEAFEAAVAAFGWRSIDAELADLVFDSALQDRELVGVRSNETSRQLTFEAPHLAVELEFDPNAECPIVGQLVPAGAAEVEICSSDNSLTVHADEQGRFWARETPGRVVSLRIRHPAGDIDRVITPWVSLVAPSAS